MKRETMSNFSGIILKPFMATIIVMLALCMITACSSNTTASTSNGAQSSNTASSIASTNNYAEEDTSNNIETVTRTSYGLSEVFTSGDYNVWFFPMQWDQLSYKTPISHTLVFDGLDYTCYKITSSDERFTLDDIDSLTDDEIVELAKSKADDVTEGTVSFIYQRDSSGNSISWECISGLPSEIGSSSSQIRANGVYYHVFKYDSNLSATTVLSNDYFGVKQQVNNMGYPLFTRSKTATAPKISVDSLGAEGLVDYEKVK